MKKLIVGIIMLTSSFGSFAEESFVDKVLNGKYNLVPYAVVGVGYKFQESLIRVCSEDRSRLLGDGSYFTQCWSKNSPWSARFEIGVDGGNFRAGISHDSQWSTGYPFNNRAEYGKTEVFIDYVYRWE